MALRLLIASRRSTTRERLRTALESRGHEVCASCADAAETIAATRRRVDVCVIHLDLPGGGFTACRALASRSRPPRLLILAPSTRERDVAAAGRAGGGGFVVPDGDAEGVPDAGAEVARGRPFLSARSTAHLIAELRAPEGTRATELTNNDC